MWQSRLRSKGVEIQAKPHQTLEVHFLRQRTYKGGHVDKREEAGNEEKQLLSEIRRRVY
jgi:hypothetical protein